MLLVDILRWLHVIGACVLFGTGAGIAFFMLMAHRTGDARLIAHVGGTVVIADGIFTGSAVVAQPITGYLLAREINWSMSEGWIVASLLLYVFAGALWLPVVWIQIKLRDLARTAVAKGLPLGPDYHRLFWIWFASGFPAFAAVMAILWLMLMRPHFKVF